MKTTLKTIAWLIGYVALLGFICPYLISAPDTSLVLFGAALIIGVILSIFFHIKNLIKIMKPIISKFLLGIVLLMALIAFTSCSSVPPGYGGVVIKKFGSEKGVQKVALGVGTYWLGPNKSMQQYPTHQVNYTFTKDKGEGTAANEEFTFQTNEGMECSTDLGIAMHYEFTLIPQMYQKYLKGEDEIRGTVVRNSIRNYLNKVAGGMPVESVYGRGKSTLIDSVQLLVKKELDGTGIIIEKIYLIGSIRIPESVKQSLDSKVKATQDAQKIENDVRATKAEAEKAVAKAEGEAKALLTVATAQATANRLISQSITPVLVNYKAIEKWKGDLPQYTGGAIPFINLK